MFICQFNFHHKYLSFPRLSIFISLDCSNNSWPERFSLRAFFSFPLLLIFPNSVQLCEAMCASLRFPLAFWRSRAAAHNLTVNFKQWHFISRHYVTSSMPRTMKIRMAIICVRSAMPSRHLLFQLRRSAFDEVDKSFKPQTLELLRRIV